MSLRSVEVDKLETKLNSLQNDISCATIFNIELLNFIKEILGVPSSILEMSEGTVEDGKAYIRSLKEKHLTYKNSEEEKEYQHSLQLEKECRLNGECKHICLFDCDCNCHFFTVPDCLNVELLEYYVNCSDWENSETTFKVIKIIHYIMKHTNTFTPNGEANVIITNKFIHMLYKYKHAIIS